MKKIFLALLAVLLMAGVSQATLGQTIAAVETTTSSITIQDDYDVDGDVSGILLYYAEGANLGPSALTLVDSIVQSDTPTDPDTFTALSGLKHNTYYSIMTVLRDSVATDTINYDTSDVATILTEGIGFTLTTEDLTYRSFQIHVELANIDSACNYLILEVDPGTGTYTVVDRDSSIDNADDSLDTPAAPTDLVNATRYNVHVIATDSTGTDTATTEVVTSDFDWGTWHELPGWNESRNLFHVKYQWANSGNTLSLPFDISPYEWVKVWVKLIGFDNNEANDSAYVFLSSYANGAQVFGDTLITADVDTGRAAEAWFLKPQVSNEVDTLVGTWGTDLRLNVTSSSGDTTAIDTRYLEGWLMFK